MEPLAITSLGEPFEPDHERSSPSHEAGRWGDFTCLNSLRDVEPNVGLILDERSIGVEAERPLVAFGEQDASTSSVATERQETAL